MLSIWLFRSIRVGKLCWVGTIRRLRFDKLAFIQAFRSIISFRLPTTREAVHDRESIESALQRVKSGELSPAEATQLLLSGEVVLEAEPRYESLASLVDRLGVPPRDIVDSWCQQLCNIASQHEHETGKSLPAIDLNQWSITPQGQFVWNGRLLAANDDGNQPTQTSLDRIDQFRTTLIPTAGTDNIPCDTPAAVSEPTNDPFAGPARNKNRDRDSNRDSDKNEKRADRAWFGPRTRQVLFAAAVLGCAGIGGWILYRSSEPVMETAANKDTSATFATDVGPPATADVGEIPSTEPIGSSAAALDSLDGRALETLESMTEAELSALEEEIETSDPLSLDALMPAAASFVPNASITSASSSTDSREDTEATNANAADKLGEAGQTDSGIMNEQASGSASVKEVLGDDDDAPAESPQQTRDSTVMAIQLSPVDDPTTATKLADRPLDGLKLDFPFDVPLQIQGEQSPWEIRDTRKEMAIAVISNGPGRTELKWSDDADQSASVSALVHGRITDRSGDTVFLRPLIEADPWPIRVDKPDVMPTWDLRQPIPPRVARLSIDLDLPDDIEAGWIESVEPESLRRARGLAVLTPKDGESVSLGIRFDIRCSRKLSCRVRYAGRLDASMPWQVVSVPLLEQFANQLTQQAILVSKEATRLDSVYEIAGSSGRRILRVKQNRNDALAETIRTASQRVAQLQTLIATIEAAATLRVRVWVEWPDTEQTLLTTDPSDSDPSDSDAQ